MNANILRDRIANREYIMGQGVLNPDGMLERLVIDVAADQIVLRLPLDVDGPAAMINYAKKNNIKTQMALAAEYGTESVLVIIETY